MERLQEILALLENPEDLSDQQIGELETELTGLYEELREDLSESDDLDERQKIVDDLTSIVEATDAVRGLASVRYEEAEKAETEQAEKKAAQDKLLEELDTRVKAEANDEEDDSTEEEEETTDSTDDGDDGGEDDEDGGGEVTDEEIDALIDEEEAKSKEPVTASLKELNRRQPKRFKAVPKRHPKVRIFARGTAGGEFSSRIELEEEMLDRWRNMQGVEGPGGRIPIARFQTSFPDDRTFAEGRIEDVNEYVDKIHRSLYVEEGPDSHKALTADGGLCTAVDVWYDLENISQASRPLRGSLVNFNSRRGGIRFDSPMTIADIGSDGSSPDAAIGAMTAAEDAAGDTNKTYQMIECGTPTTVEVEAVWRQLQFGNFVARTNPERVSHFTDLSIAAYARYSEQRLFAKMAALSSPTGSVQEFGALRDLLRNINRGATNYRNRHRMARNATIRVDLPSYIIAMCQDDMTAALNSEIGMLNLTEAQINSFFATRNIRVVWRDDEFTGAQADGASLNAYPATFTYLLGHEGGWFYVDNGQLDLGLFRDSTLVNDNVFRTFVEEFWNVAYLGIESRRVTASFCPNGASAGSVEPVCGS